MELGYLLLLHSYPTDHGPPPPEDPGPEGAEGERVGEDDRAPADDPAERLPAPGSPTTPASPDADRIDPRVFRTERGSR